MPTSAFRGSRVAQTRSRVATTARLGTPEEQAQARRDHAAATLESHISRIVGAAPPLTAEQRDRLAALLRPSAVGGTP